LTRCFSSYTPQQLYSVIADVDAYQSFLPFATDSRVLSAVRLSTEGKGKATQRTQDKGWLVGGAHGEQWEMDAELKIGAMGYNEGYVSKVQTKKWEMVAVRLVFFSKGRAWSAYRRCCLQATAKDSSLFKHLVTTWHLSPLPTSSQSASPDRPRTRVDLHLAYAFVSPFHAAAVGAMWEKVSGMMVGGFEKRVEDVYGK
jgi:coenzyme Q-binding protein COQ10